MRPVKGATKFEWETIHLLKRTKIKFLGVKYYFLCSFFIFFKKSVCVFVGDGGRKYVKFTLHMSMK